MNLNGTEEDRRLFKERSYKLSQVSHGEGLQFRDTFSYHTSQHSMHSKVASEKPSEQTPVAPTLAQALAEDQEAEEFFQFPTGNHKQFAKKSPEKKQ